MPFDEYKIEYCGRSVLASEVKCPLCDRKMEMVTINHPDGETIDYHARLNPRNIWQTLITEEVVDRSYVKMICPNGCVKMEFNIEYLYQTTIINR